MKTYIKSILRDIRAQWVQFVSIVLIVALGVSFFIGIRVTGSNMKDTADHYYQTQKLMDIQLISSLGFDDNSLEYLQKQYPEATIEATKYQDFLANLQQQDVSLRLFEYREDGLNRPTLVEGNWPQTTSEIVLDAQFMEREQLSIGDSFEVEGQDDLKQSSLTIVGKANSILYLNVYRGASRVGDGKLSGYGFLVSDAFVSDVYTALWLWQETDISSFDQAYTSAVDAWKTSLENDEANLAKIRLETIRAPLQKELDEAQSKLDEETIKANTTLSNAKKDLDLAQTQLESAKQSIDGGIKELYTQLELVDTGKSWESALNELQQKVDSIEDEGTQKLNQLNNQITQLKQQIIQAEAQGASQAQIAELQATLDQLQLVYQTQSEQLKTSTQTLRTAISSLRQASGDYQSGLVKWQEGLDEYEQAKGEADQAMADAQTKLDDAQQELDDLESPSFLIQQRKDMVVGYGDFIQDSDRIAAIGQVFPVIFFLVAALVCLSSISRMVEEERTQTGVLEALGYTSFAIQMKYITYSGLASLIGIVLGALIGFNMIPNIIFEAYRILYTMPSLITMFKLEFFILPCLAALLCTVGVAIFVSAKNTRHTPASLMRPVAPKAGKRIIFERIKPLWKRLSFLHKVSLRNLFLDRSRFLMSVIGIAGCMGLLITGFGLNDSIKPLVKVQFDEITHYDTVVSVDNAISHENQTKLIEAIRSQDNVEAYITMQNVQIEAIGPISVYEASMVVVEDVNAIDQFVTMKDYRSQTSLALGDDGVIIDQKLSELVDVAVGDYITVREGDRQYQFKVSGIMENYISHSLYVTPEVYQQVTGKTFAWNSILMNLKNTEETTKSQISSELMSQSGVLALTHISDSRDAFADMMGSFDIVVVVIAGAASLLAFVVMTNLTSMNINERIKEIATLKVLGFYDKENYAYIMRENIMLVFIGCVFGSFFGYFLHQYIILTVEVDLIMFYRQLSWRAVVISVVLTFMFSLLVNLFMNRKIKRINMIEALKSVD